MQAVYRDAAPNLAIFTICSNNHIARARVLLASARKFHPEAALYLCLADTPLPRPGLYPDGCALVPINALDIPEFQSFVRRYDLKELNVATKPFMFRYLLGRGHDRVLYFDSDIQVFSRLDRILGLLDAGASFVLTPHLCMPAEGNVVPDDMAVLRTGVFNLGFLAVHAGAEADAILAWWARRLLWHCRHDPKAGLFGDQRFMDLVPGFAEQARILRDPTANLAYWNLSQRVLDQDGDTWTVDGQPLGFFHFSGFDPRRPDRLSAFTDAFQGKALPPPLARLIASYVAELRAQPDAGLSPRLHIYGGFDPVTRCRIVLRAIWHKAAQRLQHLVYG